MKYKILTMCAGGNVRSVGLKYLLKYKYGHEALSCGQDANSSETIEMLSNWADYVIVLAGEYIKFVPKSFKGTVLLYDVGSDRFGYAFHPELIQMLEKMIVEHGLFNK